MGHPSLRRDSIDKIVDNYFAAITSHDFTYKGTTYKPAPLKANSNFLRGFTCPSMCGGCCPTFSLDYIEKEEKPYAIPLRIIEFNGKSVSVWSDEQDENKGNRCKNLNKENGRCGIHGKQPFSCDFELIRFIRLPDYWTVSERLFGRGWNMGRVDGGKGALCTITPPTTETALDVARRIKRLCEWADEFGLKDHKASVLLKYATRFSLEPTKAPAITI